MLDAPTTDRGMSDQQVQSGEQQAERSTNHRPNRAMLLAVPLEPHADAAQAGARSATLPDDLRTMDQVDPIREAIRKPFRHECVRASCRLSARALFPAFIGSSTSRMPPLDASDGRNESARNQ